MKIMGHFYLAFRMSSDPSLAAKTAKACEGEGGAGHDAELEFRT